MPTYKLTYFNVTGLAEQIRYMFNYGGIKFEDIRLNTDDWPKLKTDMPLGQVPVLEVDGKKYNQSKAIGRYVAKQCKLYGLDDIEALEIDAAIDSLDDMRQAVSIYYHEKDPVIKEKLKQTTFEKLSFFLNKFEEQVKKNGGHFIRGKLTWPDFAYAASSKLISEFASKEFNINQPEELKKLMDKVNTIPSVKAYLDKRPKTLF